MAEKDGGSVMTRTNRVPRWLSSAQRSAAFQAEKMRQANTPAERVVAARDALLAAAARAPKDRIPGVAKDVIIHAARVASRAGQPDRSREWHRDQLDEATTERDRLARAIRWLSSGLSALPDDIQDEWREHYAKALGDEVQVLMRRDG